MSKLQQQILLGLTQSVPNSFMGGMQMAERRAQAARAEQARRDALGLRAKQFQQTLPIQLSNAEARMMGARTAAGALDLNTKKYGSRNEDTTFKTDEGIRGTLVKKAPGLPEASAVASGQPYDPNELVQQAQDRHVKQTSRDAFARGGAETSKKVTQKTLMDEGKIATTGPISNSDFAYREQVKGNVRKRIQDALQNGRIDLATANALSKGLLQEGDASLSPQLQGIYGHVPRPGVAPAQAPGPAQAPAMDPRTKAKEEYKALIQQGMPPNQAQAAILQKYPGIQ